MKDIIHDVETKMKHAVDHLHHELKQLRTGRASTSILDGVVVEYYGNPTPLSKMANVSVADATMLVAQPWDVSQMAAIEKAIRAANLGLNPTNDGKIVRIPVPPLTEDRRKDLVKRAHDMAEHARTAVRAARRDGNDRIKAMEKDKKIGQDEERRGHDDVQKVHDKFIDEIAKALQTKEKDILVV